jgi:hypothetical protein
MLNKTPFLPFLYLEKPLDLNLIIGVELLIES